MNNRLGEIRLFEVLWKGLFLFIRYAPEHEFFFFPYPVCRFLFQFPNYL